MIEVSNETNRGAHGLRAQEGGDLIAEDAMYELPKLHVSEVDVEVDAIYTDIYGDKFFIPASRDEKRRWFAELLKGSAEKHGEFANLHSLKYRVYQAWVKLGWAEFTNAHFPGDMIGFRITESGKEVLGAKYA